MPILYTAKERTGPIVEHSRSAREIGRKQRLADSLSNPVASGVDLQALILLYRQLATLVHAGLPLYQSLVTLEGQTRNRELAPILRACHSQVQSGGKLSDVLAVYPAIFRELQVEMIRAGEEHGRLDRMLASIADYLEQEMALRRLIAQQTFYPIMLAGIILPILIPPSLLLTSGLLIGVVVVLVRRLLIRSERARMNYEQIKWALPGIGGVVRKLAQARFGRAFATLYDAGVPLSTAIRVAGSASGSPILTHAGLRAMASTEWGAPLSQAFRETGVFSPVVLDMLATGEQTGNVDTMMHKMAEYYEGEAEQQSHQFAHLFAVALFLLVALLFAIVIIGSYTGLANSTASEIANTTG